MRHFTQEYVERVTLRDGTPVLLRLLTPDDKQLLRRELERWSPESRYARFLSPKDHLSDAELAYLCEIDQEHHFALGAIAEAGDGHGEPDALGLARFIRLPGTAIAEPAIAVADRAQGRGLGRLLFLRLCAAAAERGIEQFSCEVLCDNHAMQNLIDEIAPNRTISVEQGVSSIQFDLAAFAPDAPHTTPPELPMYKLFRAAAENLVEWTERVRGLWRR
jgi:GNAT superfamily N-acetyltransferase